MLRNSDESYKTQSQKGQTALIHRTILEAAVKKPGEIIEDRDKQLGLGDKTFF